jgi:DNA-binding IclR family transcriptional regulator
MVTFAHDLGGSLAAQETGGGLAQLEAVRIATAALPEICEQIGQRTVGIAVWGNKGATTVRWEPSKNPVSPYLQAGVVVSPTQSATGLAFCAFKEGESTQGVIEAELREKKNDGQYLETALAARLAETRQHGLARSVGGAPSERHQVTVNAFSAPVFDARGEMVLALSTTCRADLLEPDWDGPVPTALLKAARTLSERLGHKAVQAA